MKGSAGCDEMCEETEEWEGSRASTGAANIKA